MRRDLLAIEYNRDQVTLFSGRQSSQLKILVKGILMQYEFEIGFDIYLPDIAFAQGGGDCQPVFNDPDIQLLGKAGHEIKRGVNREFEYHSLENSSISN